MKKYSFRLYFFNLGRNFYWRLEARNFKIFLTIVGWFTKDRASLNSFNILGMMEVQQGQELLRNYIFRNRREKIYFHVLFPWNSFQIFSFSSSRCFIFRTTQWKRVYPMEFILVKLQACTAQTELYEIQTLPQILLEYALEISCLKKNILRKIWCTSG